MCAPTRLRGRPARPTAHPGRAARPDPLAARRLFCRAPHTSVTTADVADAAGVARSLVHHYFGGIRGVFMAVVAQGGAELAEVRTAGPETPLEERIAFNVVRRPRRVAAIGRPGSPSWARRALADPEVRALAEVATERSVERTLEVITDVIHDTPDARLALRCFHAFATEAAREWLSGQATRKQTEALLRNAFRDLLLKTIPTLETRN